MTFLRALILVVATLAALSPTMRRPALRDFDQPFYLGIAFDIVHHGRFTDGYRFSSVGADGMRPAGMRFSPLVPVLLAAEAELDPTFRQEVDCLVLSRGADRSCGAAPPAVLFLQAAALAFSLALVFPLALAAGLGRRAATMALVLALGAAPLLLSVASYLMTEIPTLLFSTAGGWMFVRAASGDERGAAAGDERGAAAGGGRAAFLAGLLFGGAALCRPAFLYLLLLLAAFLLARAAPRRAHVASAALLLAGAALAVGPAVARNALVFGRPALTAGYAGHTLAQRVSFDQMGWRDYALSFPCWLPDGNGIGRMLAGPGACAPFGWNESPRTYYAIGLRRFVPQFTEAAGGPDHLAGFIFTHEIRPHLAWHVLTTLPLALRGLWIEHWWGFVLAITLAATLVRAVRTADRRMLALIGPPLAMLAFNAAVAVDQARYNLELVPVDAVAGAAFATRFIPQLRSSDASDRRYGRVPPPRRPDPSRSRCPAPLPARPPEAWFPFPRRGRGPPRRRPRGA